MTFDQYKELKARYGNIASWAIWQLPDGSPKSNMQDVSMFDNVSHILPQLNTRYVFVGLNGSGLHDAYMDNNRPWHNFHSSSPHGNDFKLRYAAMGTPFWGAYITDLIKGYQEADSVKVETYLKAHPEYLLQNILEFRSELALLGSSPVIIALGNTVYQYLIEHLGNDFTIRKIHHYSYTSVSKESYREELLSLLDKSENISISEQPPVKSENTPKPPTSDDPKQIPSAISASQADLFHAKLIEAELDDETNWTGKIAPKLLKLYTSCLAGSRYTLQINTTDTTKDSLNLFREGQARRVMGFEKIKNRMILIYPTTPFYEELKHLYLLPEPNPKKAQPHIKVSPKQLWELFCILSKH